MAKFSGLVGFGISEEIRPGIWEDRIYERRYNGDVIRDQPRFEAGQDIHKDVVLMNSISLVANAYLRDHVFAVRYIRWQGVRWEISNVTIARPRLIFRLGGVYNGPAASAE